MALPQREYRPVSTVFHLHLTFLRHTATDNFAERLNRISTNVAERLNQGKSVDDVSRARRAVIVRGYNPDDEVKAFANMIRNPAAGDDAAPTGNWFRDSEWKLNYSVAYWLLRILRSPGVPALHRDDASVLYEIQAKLDVNLGFTRLRDAATGKDGWPGTELDKIVSMTELRKVFTRIIYASTVLCVTPGLSEAKPFVYVKNNAAKGIAVDEAGNMSRPDLYSVWGNTLLPLVLAGDDKVCPNLQTSYWLLY